MIVEMYHVIMSINDKPNKKKIFESNAQTKTNQMMDAILDGK